jgi:hypothetical protein
MGRDLSAERLGAVFKLAATGEEELLARIREATRSGKPVGAELSVAELARKAGIGLELRPPGRPPKRLALGAAGG